MVRVHLNKMQMEYLDWLKDKITDIDGTFRYSYNDLLNYLYLYKLDYNKLMRVPMDLNRADNGLYLRYEFGREYGYTNEQINNEIRDRCSMLELMVALSVDIERLMEDASFGDRTNVWFWQMVTSLGLSQMDDFGFSRARCCKILDKFENRKYNYNGKGGLFYIENPKFVIQETEIWKQANAYLNELDNS